MRIKTCGFIFVSSLFLMMLVTLIMGVMLFIYQSYVKSTVGMYKMDRSKIEHFMLFKKKIERFVLHHQQLSYNEYDDSIKKMLHLKPETTYIKWTSSINCFEINHVLYAAKRLTIMTNDTRTRKNKVLYVLNIPKETIEKKGCSGFILKKQFVLYQNFLEMHRLRSPILYA